MIVTMFITEPAGDPSDFVIFLEINRLLGTAESTDLIGNAQLIE